MCKRRSYSRSAQFATAPAYEGQTVQLDATQHLRAARRCRHVPWWTLWLLWPVLAGLKWIAPLWIGVVATLMNALNSSNGVIVAVALIVAGLLLIVRNQTEQEEYDA